MKTLLCILVSLYGFTITAQSSLLGGSAILEIEAQKVYIQQTLEVQLPDSVQQLKLRILDFEGSFLSNISVSSNGKDIHFEKEVLDGISTIKLNSTKGFQQLQLSYEVATAATDFYIPFFFTDLVAANSENDFFKMTIKLPETQDYVLHFPNLLANETVNGGKKKIVLDVPALISVMRMELVDEKKAIGFAGMMDALVALIFVVIGIAIWLNRKRLAYG